MIVVIVQHWRKTRAEEGAGLLENTINTIAAIVAPVLESIFPLLHLRWWLWWPRTLLQNNRTSSYNTAIPTNTRYLWRALLSESQGKPWGGQTPTYLCLPNMQLLR